MTTTSSRFGKIDFEPEDIVHFEEGMIGFPDIKEYLLISHNKPESPFRWLQAIDEPALAFLLVTPTHFFKEYEPELKKEVADELKIKEDTPRLVYATVSIPRGCPQDLTINLAGPVLINLETQQAKQVVLDDGAYTIKHRVFEQVEEISENIAA